MQAQLVRRRGTLSLRGPLVDSIADRWNKIWRDQDGSDRVEPLQAHRTVRDGPHYHITVCSAQECKRSKIFSDENNDNNDPCAIEVGALYDLGVGTVLEKCYYVVIVAPTLQALRKRYGLAPIDLHITLGFKGNDVHGDDIDKGIGTLEFDNERALACTTESLLSAAGTSGDDLISARVADYMMNRGYLFGAYYVAKFGLAGHGLKATYQMLEEYVQTARYQGGRLAHPTNRQYGPRVCKVLNHNVHATKPYHKVRRYYSYKYTEPCGDETTPVYCNVTFVDLPRNFSYVSKQLVGSSIPNKREYFEAFVSMGITDIITVMETPTPKYLYEGLPLRCHFFEVDDMCPPSMEQMEAMVQIIDTSDGAVVVHCRGGVGRTGTVLAAHAMWSENKSRADALKPLVDHRKTMLRDCQQDFLRDWYKRCAAKQREQAQAPSGLPPVIMTVGYPSSGKSTLSQALAEYYPSHVHRLNQDEQGRRECENQIGALAKRGNGHTVLLDRCNLTREERQQWLSLAHNKKAWCIYFDVPFEECMWRIVRRKGHPTIREGGGARLLKSLQGTLDEPTKSEGFDRVHVVRTFEDANALLLDWGCTAMPVSTLPEEEGMVKFPRTRHVQNLGSASRDDLVMTVNESKIFLNRPIYVEEKVDGANMGISIRNHQLVAQNRSHFITSDYHKQFKHLDKWLAEHSNDLWTILQSDRFILYGEWLFACHSIPYARLPDWFMAFDLYDRLEERFVSRQRLEERLRDTSIALVPLAVPVGTTFSKPEELRALVQTPSQFYDGPVEGVYLRVCDEQWLQARGKIVRSDFICGDFWSKKGVQRNGLVDGHF